MDDYKTIFHPDGVDYSEASAWSRDYREEVKNVEIQEGVKSIGEYAFYKCSKLDSVNLPNGMTSIGDLAFEYCSSLTDIKIPEGITSLSVATFADCSSLSERNKFEKNDPFTISGYSGTAAETYAEKDGFEFKSLDTQKPDETEKTDDIEKTDDTQKPDDTTKSDDTGKSDTTKPATNIISIDTTKGTAEIPDLVAGKNEEVPLAVVVEGAVYRMYNPNSGEHFYTKSSAERDSLVDSGWNYEGVSFYAFSVTTTIGSPQYRLYNPNDGQHHWTVDSNERDSLVGLGWQDEGTAWRVK